jgi:hypothetical protein
MPLFAIGFCYIIPLAHRGIDAPVNAQLLSVADPHKTDRIGRKNRRW